MHLYLMWKLVFSQLANICVGEHAILELCFPLIYLLRVSTLILSSFFKYWWELARCSRTQSLLDILFSTLRLF